jgi:hypothetical protein
MKFGTPAAKPCGSCPYRRDVPSGIWAAEEYAKLPEYDKPTGEQPPSVFLCHRQDGRLCAGWVAVHDMDECLGLRIAAATGAFTEPDAVLNYVTDVPLWGSGAEAAAHGRADLDSPGEEARKVMRKLRGE